MSRPLTPSWLDSVRIIGAKATMGTVWLMIAQGITLISITRQRTMAMARPTPRTIPSAKPSIVPRKVT